VLFRSRDLDQGVEHFTRLRVVSMGADSDGDPITSCVVEHELHGGATAGGPKMKGSERGVHNVYTQAMQTEAVIIDPSIIQSNGIMEGSPQGKRDTGQKHGLEIKRVRELFMVANRDTDGTRTDTLRHSFNRGLKYLQARDGFNVFDGFMWSDEIPNGTRILPCPVRVPPDVPPPALQLAERDIRDTPL